MYDSSLQRHFLCHDMSAKIKQKRAVKDSCGLVKTRKKPKARSSRPEVFCKKGVLRNFAKFTGKHLCQDLLFNKVAGPGLQL